MAKVGSVVPAMKIARVRLRPKRSESQPPKMQNTAPRALLARPRYPILRSSSPSSTARFDWRGRDSA